MQDEFGLCSAQSIKFDMTKGRVEDIDSVITEKKYLELTI